MLCLLENMIVGRIVSVCMLARYDYRLRIPHDVGRGDHRLRILYDICAGRGDQRLRIPYGISASREDYTVD
jgi:hypothetical protein